MPARREMIFCISHFDRTVFSDNNSECEFPGSHRKNHRPYSAFVCNFHASKFRKHPQGSDFFCKIDNLPPHPFLNKMENIVTLICALRIVCLFWQSETWFTLFKKTTRILKSVCFFFSFFRTAHLVKKTTEYEWHPARLGAWDAFSQYPSRDSFATIADQPIADTSDVAWVFLSYWHTLPLAYPSINQGFCISQHRSVKIASFFFSFFFFFLFQDKKKRADQYYFSSAEKKISFGSENHWENHRPTNEKNIFCFCFSFFAHCGRRVKPTCLTTV